MASTDRQRWTRVRPHLAWKHPGLPTTWTRVLERNPEQPGYVWIATPGTRCTADERHLEFTHEPPKDPTAQEGPPSDAATMISWCLKRCKRSVRHHPFGPVHAISVIMLSAACSTSHSQVGRERVGTEPGKGAGYIAGAGGVRLFYRVDGSAADTNRSAPRRPRTQPGGTSARPPRYESHALVG
jgi:hypothetical protein